MKWAKLVYFGVLGFAGGSIATSYADTKKSVSAAQVNGTWKTTSGEFKIWALGKQRDVVRAFSWTFFCPAICSRFEQFAGCRRTGFSVVEHHFLDRSRLVIMSQNYATLSLGNYRAGDQLP